MIRICWDFPFPRTGNEAAGHDVVAGIYQMEFQK